ncbi:hypothetical protein P153DRAFT_371504 [Dothidotthia symphoricarpi CBS 119687]|uniref:Uncharacterized protein n=1 Tax=Dothidotthia symphoricarpi CBS 119687 TaxID=1392245 RepID=A0A6A5ZXR2_9PLEO|nr:uncharacterized protein P153DRAFT_371504 [Dothidotthia symphoricarpi CBS 119687]KAF2123694.1 hypothetical protein P153DRAFT_371504 [Dothidotthia symphoricarpi CBS 119687]
MMVDPRILDYQRCRYYNLLWSCKQKAIEVFKQGAQTRLTKGRLDGIVLVPPEDWYLHSGSDSNEGSDSASNTSTNSLSEDVASADCGDRIVVFLGLVKAADGQFSEKGDSGALVFAQDSHNTTVPLGVHLGKSTLWNAALFLSLEAFAAVGEKPEHQWDLTFL